MKKILFSIAFALICMTSFNSCTMSTYATTQDDIYVETYSDVVYTDVDFNLVIRYGTPYYYNGTLLYYIYNNLYYYPYWYGNYWYVRVYRKPFTHLNHRPYFRPNKHDYRFSPGVHKGFGTPNVNRHNPPKNRPNVNNRPTPSRPNINNRPSTPPRTNRPTGSNPNRGNGGKFGGGRR